MRFITGLILLFGILVPIPAWTADATPEKTGDTPALSISEDMGQAISRQADHVKKQIEQQAHSLFQREPLGFSWQTVDHLYTTIVRLPSQIPLFYQALIEQARLLGVVGSAVMLIFIVALVYSFLGQKRVMAHIESKLAPFQNRLPQKVYAYILPAHRVVVSALFPLLLLAVYALISALITYEAHWFTLIGKLITLWAVAALILKAMQELLTCDIFKVPRAHAKTIFGISRLIIFYAIPAIALFWSGQAFELRQDVLALLKFAISLSIVLVLFLLMLKKKALLSLLPDLPHRSFQKFLQLMQRFYYPLIFLSLILALFWSVGYRSLGREVLVNIWSSGAAYVMMMVGYHFLFASLQRWHEQTDKNDEAAQWFFRSLKILLVYCVAIATILIVLNLLGLLGLLEQAMSFTVFRSNKGQITLWILLEAALIIVAFIFLSRLTRSYLDYKVYPAVGIEAGLGYALNTSLKYIMLATGVLVSLNIVGLDLRFLLVFAGAIGIGIGMGLQNMAANIIAGFTLIFGGKLRKGDWIEVADTMGMVTDIYLGATNVRTRDEIEYLIPNSDFINGTLVNYSLGSPLIRINVPVGVSYSADPRTVEKLLLTAAQNEPDVSKEKPPMVRFVSYGDSSIDFELLIWINVRNTPRRKVRSALYFTIFEALAKAGIEIPFPQRDIHIRSTVAGNPSPIKS